MDLKKIYIALQGTNKPKCILPATRSGYPRPFQPELQKMTSMRGAHDDDASHLYLSIGWDIHHPQDQWKTGFYGAFADFEKLPPYFNTPMYLLPYEFQFIIRLSTRTLYP